MPGALLVKLAFVTCLMSAFLYFQHRRRASSAIILFARATYIATAALVVAASGYLLSLILTHQFQYTYVWSYSSRELPTPLLISTFYAGQEGSFMLWALFTAIIGLFLFRHAARYGYEAEVMGIFALIKLALLVMLLVKNPFLYVWETWAGEVQAGFVPADGRGLNPLLQNYWMVIHPQVLFSGFAAMSVPYAYAIAALLKRDYDHWFRAATPWLVFGAFVLGTGIIMGGFWAYETLGWGGYWAWDPVENSSLVPWIVCVAAIHTTLSQRKSGAFVRTNLILGMLCFVLVVYSTFLTRSGVLGDTSVHSFVDPGMWAYGLLVGMLVLFVALPLVIMIRRWKEMPRRPAKHDYYSREFLLFLGSAALIFAAIFIVAGTSSPIITDLLYGEKSAVDISYYVKTTFPLGVLIALLAGLGQLLWWNRSEKRDLLRAVTVPLFASAAVTIILVFSGVREIAAAVFLFATTFALVANLQVGWKIAKGNPKYAGGAVAHIGLAIMFFGFLASSEYDATETVALPQGSTVSTLGYRLTYTGYTQLPDERYAFQVRVDHNGKSFSLAPVMYYSKYNEGLMRNPDIANLISRDFYLAPLSLEEKGKGGATKESAEGSLRPGESTALLDLQITFLGFQNPVFHQVSDHTDGSSNPYALLMIGEEKAQAKPLSVRLDQPVEFSERYDIVATRSSRTDADASQTVLVSVRDRLAVQESAPAPAVDILMVEASVKPYINLVWAGVIVLLVGFLITIVRRAPEAMRISAGVEQGS